ncbi:protein of unknown function [Cyclobacterium xiamenense]|uniref:Type 9 secretion system plug protein N-terminal domain-containing protein n=1 Tax=Cyclobacterium xiamenense TaxID=1297121 RepID=A0A1H6Z667_9BACT|nr:DUF5103 domain-containing protein [Cyclobacterium xiamenense]SEJ48878.1 protein of unknown function [Cyclobacterium xiamenense]
MKQVVLMLLFISGLAFASPSASAQQVYEDQVVDPNIHTVQLYPETGDFQAQMTAPVIALNSGLTLTLQFDDIAYEADRYSAKLIHCNADWTQSGLRDPDFLEQYNEFNVNSYEYSINTRIPYIHYTFRVPRVIRSGNYVIQVYRGRDKSATLFTKRFMVYENQVAIGAAVVPTSLNEDRLQRQQLDVTVNYGNRELIDPLNQTRLVIRQNQRWGNAINGLPYTQIREDRKQLQYRLFDGSNTFPAGNEFRFVDLRYVRTRGRNIAAITMEEDVVFAEAGMDESRKGQGYLEYLDINGQFGVFNIERQNHDLESEYVLLTFNLKSEELARPPYILGALSQWGNKPESKMTYDAKGGRYQASLFLKQGWYDYIYGLPGEEGWETEPFEGNHFQTENEYEIFFYYRDMGSRYDELIGYSVVNPNKRRL